MNHYTKWNRTVKHLIKNEGIHCKYNCQRPAVAASDMAGKNTPNSSTRLQRKLPHTKYSSRQLIYTKATRIFLQHQILELYTALLLKGQCGFFLLASLKRILSHIELDTHFLFFGRGGEFDYACILWMETVTGRALCCSTANGFCFVVFPTSSATSPIAELLIRLWILT